MARVTIRSWIARLHCALMLVSSAPCVARDLQPMPQAEARRSQDLSTQGFVGLTRKDAKVAGRVALTFDDGPHVTHTPRVLGLLEREGLTATFFLIGGNITRSTFRLVQRMRDGGHLIGSHSYDHDVRMADGRFGSLTVDYIRGEHEATQVLVELALLAASETDFDALYAWVFESKPNARLSAQRLIHWPQFVERHQQLLESKGYSMSNRPYAINFTRPPGGGPYFGADRTLSRARYDRALRDLGWLNVLWHDGCWDPDPERRRDPSFIKMALRSQFRRGGVIVIHDYVPFAPLSEALEGIRLAHVEAVSLEELVQAKYGTSARSVVLSLQHANEPTEQVVASRNDGLAPSSI